MAGFPRGPVRGQWGPPAAASLPRPRSDLESRSACEAPMAASSLRPGCWAPIRAGRGWRGGWARPASPLRLPVRPPRRATRPPGTPHPPHPPPRVPLALLGPPTLALRATGPPGIPHPDPRPPRSPPPHPSQLRGLPSLAGTPLQPPPALPGCLASQGHTLQLPAGTPSWNHGAEGGSSALGCGEQFCAQRAPPPQPRTCKTALQAPGRAGAQDTRAVARCRGGLDFERQTELIAISANCRARPGGGRGCPQPASTWKGGREVNRNQLELSRTLWCGHCRGQGGVRVTPVHTKAGCFTTCSHWHKGLISQTRGESHGSRSAGSADFPGQRPASVGLRPGRLLASGALQIVHLLC